MPSRPIPETEPAEPALPRASTTHDGAPEQPQLEQQAIDGLLVFHDVARALTSSLDLDSILSAIMQQMEKFFAPESWSLLMVDTTDQTLGYTVAAGRSTALLNHLRIPLGAGIAGWVALRGESLVVPDVSTDPRFDPRWDAPPVAERANDSEGNGCATVRSVLCAPLRWQQRTLGVIQLLNYRVHLLNDYTLTFLQVLCEYAAIAIENARAMQRIQELTITDDCTGLYNSRHLFSVVEREIERSRRFHLPFGLVFIDLDHFKRINDAHGHLVGSRLLAEVAQTIRSTIRSVDSAFRYGGDEFIVLLPQTTKDAAVEMTQRLLECLRQVRYLKAENLNVTMRASFGIASYPEDGETAKEIIEAADQMMYLVKRSSRNSIAVAQRGCIPA